MIVQELQRLMRAEIAKAVTTALEQTKEVAEAVARNVANDVAQDVVQNALEAFQADDLPDEDSQTDLALALREAFTSSEPPAKSKRRSPRVRLDKQTAKPGSLAVAKAGNNSIPVRIVAGPFMIAGKTLYKVERLTPGKNFTGGMKPLEDLYTFTEGDAEALGQSSAPPSSKR